MDKDLFFKKTKIVATIGPAIDNEEKIEELINAGVNVFRLNTSHGSIEAHKESILKIRKVCEKISKIAAIMVDLQGPKIRVGNLNSEIDLKTGDSAVFAHTQFHENNIIPVDYEGIASDVQAGSKIMLDDGKIQAVVEKVEDNKVYTKITNGGVLKSRKGLNIPGSTNSLKAVTDKDVEFIKFAAEQKADYIALSFVRQKEDVLLAKKYINDLGSDIPVISKLEKPQAIENLESIVNVSDCIMVARGDLGIELSPVEVPIAQKKIIEECTKQKKPVIVATQMLESMIESPIPTRAESSDVANAIIDGADAVMLSGETSVGKFPKAAVETMSNIAHNVEDSGFYKFDRDFEICEEMELTRQSIAFGADKMLKYVDAKAIVSFSYYGQSTKLMSKLKPCAPVILISNNMETCRKMSLIWGVYPFYKNWDDVLDRNLIVNIDNFLLNEVGFNKGDYIIITGSAPKLISGQTNFIRIHRISE